MNRSELKVGELVEVFEVGEYLDGKVRIKQAKLCVAGDEAGVPLCLRHDSGGGKWDSPRTVFGRHGSFVLQFHEVSFSEQEAIERWRGGKLQELVKHEQAIAELRVLLSKPIRKLIDDTVVARPEKEGIMRVRIDE